MEEEQKKFAGAILRPGDKRPDWAALELGTPFGRAQVGLDVAGLRVRTQGLSDDQKSWCAGRYGVFARDGADREPQIDVQVRRAPADGFLQLVATNEPEYYRLMTEYDGDRLRCWSYRFAGWFSAKEGRGGLVLCDADGRGFESSLENFLRVVYATLALGRGGFLLHSAGLVQDGRAHLLFGPSGSGKTTSCRLAGGARIVSDDLILVLPGEDGGGPRAVSIPFRGHHAELPRAQTSFPVAGFYRLVQDQEVRLDELSLARGISELLGSLPFVTERSENGTAILEALEVAVRRVPVFRLHFRKDAAFWDLITRREGSPATGTDGR